MFLLTKFVEVIDFLKDTFRHQIYLFIFHAKVQIYIQARRDTKIQKVKVKNERTKRGKDLSSA